LGPLSRSFALRVTLTFFVTVLSLLPVAGLQAAAQTPAPTQSEADEQQGQSAPGGNAQDGGTGFIEIHLVECPPDFQSESGDAYYDTCHTNPIEDVTVNLTSTGTDSPVEASLVTEQVEANGPGLVTFEGLTAGDYEVTVDLPEADVADIFAYCSIADGDDEIPVSPDDALAGTLSLAEGQGVICDWYITPAPDTPDAPQTTIDLFAFVCDPEALPPTDDPTYEGFAEACTEPAADIPFHLVDDAARGAAGTDTVQTTDANGQADFALDPTIDYRFYAEVPLEADEYMWCAVDDGEADPKTFDDRGVTAFEGGEPQVLTCSWFLIETGDDATAQATTEAEPTAAPTESAEATTGIDAATSTEAAQAATEDAAEQGEQEGPGEGDSGQIVVSANACPQGYDQKTQGVDFESLSTNCTDPLEDVNFTLTGPDGVDDERVTDGVNDLQYLDLEPGTYTLYSSVPLEAAAEYLFCTADGGNRYEKDFNETGVTSFADLQGEQIACDWFVVPLDLRGEESGGSLEVHLAACPVKYEGDALFDDCHGNGVGDQEFRLSGPDGEVSGTTLVEQTPGPGIVMFTSLPAGEYTLQGGPPGDFGRVELFCTVQPGNEPVAAGVESTIATLTIAENQDVLCDWYYIPEDASGLVTPTPSPTAAAEPSRAEILVTLYACPVPEGDAGGYGGATFEELSATCTEPVNDVPFSLGDVGAPPLKASTGVSGQGAVRFYDLLQADYTLTPSLPSNLSSTAIFCTVDDGDPYQKTLENGATRFNGVDGESIACSWFAVEAPQTQPAAGPTGSITIREYLCEDAREDIRDWDTECTPGRSGSSFTLTSSDGELTRDGTPNTSGVHVFSELEDGFYELKQNDGMWCRAVADRVDRDSRVIVQDGGNTDVVLYQCAAVAGLPDTGTGPGGTIAPAEDDGIPAAVLAVGIAGLLAAPLICSALVKRRNRRRVADAETVDSSLGPIVTSSGKVWMRFK
jgi:hypothetical protein